MALTIYQVDAFTAKPFAGNPAAVCLLPEPSAESWMQSVAAEMNLSETAFLERGHEEFSLRWFTPTVEVDLCGHATLASDFRLLKSASREARGVIVTSRSDSPDYDFVSRYFAPAAGIDEDPVTGSTHCCLGPFWSERLGKKELRAYQASRRGGSLRVRDGVARVFISGQAVTVMRGELLTPR